MRAFFKQGDFRINAASGGALSSSDSVEVTDLKVTYEQSLDTLYAIGKDYVIQPEDDKYPEITIELTFSRLTTATDDFIGYHRDNTALKGELILTGPTLAGSNYGLKFSFPNLIVSEAPVKFKKGAANVAPEATLKAYKAAAAPTGMTGITKPFRITTTGVSTTNPFAV